MIYQYTGQPGHGKTLHAIKRALEFKAQGRRVFVCNVRGFNYEKSGTERMTPEDFRNWMEFMPDGSVALVDECYEHEMLPKRPPSAKLPAHVEQLAKHRHRGIDFIFVCQSPDKQTDVFVHDLIEEHIHVRRRFGTSFVHLRKFDRYERNPEKANPLVIKRAKLPKEIFGLYESTELDTTERKIPWYFFAFAIGAPAALGLMWYSFGGLGTRLGKDEVQPVAVSAPKQTEASADGGAGRKRSPDDYLADFTPRIPSQPWSAPAYDTLRVSNEPPRVFCMIGGSETTGTCTCLTEQGTRYIMELQLCRAAAVYGQYEPYYKPRGEREDGETQQREYEEQGRIARARRSGEGWNPSAMPPGGGAPVGVGSDEQQAGYGGFRDVPTTVH